MKGDGRRTVLITGCSTGIGRATALYLAERGWQVFATARRLHTLDEIASERIVPLYLDLTVPESCEAAVQEVLRQTGGRLGALVNNAGYGALGVLEEVSLEEARLQFETNVLGALHMCQLVAPVMREQGEGRIVNVGSAAGIFAYPLAGLYCASKAALLSLSDTLRVELRPWQIKVVVVAPGIVRSAWFDNAQRRAADLVNRPDTPYAPLCRVYQALLPTINSPKMPPTETVVRMIAYALTARHPRPYLLGPGLFWSGLVQLGRLMPASWRDVALSAFFWR